MCGVSQAWIQFVTHFTTFARVNTLVLKQAHQCDILESRRHVYVTSVLNGGNEIDNKK